MQKTMQFGMGYFRTIFIPNPYILCDFFPLQQNNLIRIIIFVQQLCWFLGFHHSNQFLPMRYAWSSSLGFGGVKFISFQNLFFLEKRSQEPIYILRKKQKRALAMAHSPYFVSLKLFNSSEAEAHVRPNKAYFLLNSKTGSAHCSV